MASSLNVPPIPRAQSDAHAWLAQKLQDERRELLLHLEDRHRHLMDDFLVVTEPMSRRDLTLAPEGPLFSAEQTDMREYQVWPKVEAKKFNDDQDEDQDEHKHPMTCIVGDLSLRFDDSAKGHVFEWFFGSVIVANACIIAMNQQYRGLQRGYDLGIDAYHSTKEDAWPGWATTFITVETCFTILFTIEFIARLVIIRLEYLKHLWCYFDGILLIFAWVLVFRRAFDVDVSVFDPIFVRLARLMKLLRLIHLLRSNPMFDSLKLLITAIHASFHVLFWSVGVLLIVISFGSLLMVQLLEPYLQESHLGDPVKLEEQKQVFAYFGTFWRSLITIFEATFANWAPSCRILVENVGESYAIFYFVYRCLIGWAVLMVVQAVFIQQTIKITHQDEMALARQKTKAKKKRLKRVRRVFERMDANKDGILDRAEFFESLKMQEVRALMEVYELEDRHFSDLYHLLADPRCGSLSLDEFVSHVEYLQGPARSIDVIEAKRDVRKIRQLLMRNKIIL